MSVATEISRLQAARNTIRNKLINLGLVDETAKLDDLADAAALIENRGAVSANVKEGETYTIPKGYHNGSGTVSGVAGGGNYSLQSKTATPTKAQQNVTPDSGYYGLSDVTVEAIPAAYQDVTSVTAGAEDTLAGKIIVDATGKPVTGTMTNNGAVTKVLDTATKSYTIPKGYHNGSGNVSITVEEKSATPTKAAQIITPTSGKVMNKVSVAAIPDKYIDTTDATALAGHILVDETAYVNGVKVTGTMANNGDVTGAINVLDDTNNTVNIPAGYTSGGVISITSDLEAALAAI